MMRLMLLLVAAPLLLAAVPPAPGLQPSELVLLLEIGVREEEIISCAERRGGLPAVDSETFAVLESLGAGPELLRRLVRTPPEFGVFSTLARASDVFDDRKTGVSFLYPAGWTATRSTRNGATVIRISPRSSAEARAFLSPCLFVFLSPESGLVPDAGPAALESVARTIQARLRDAGLRPVPGTPGEVTILGRACATVRLEASRDGAGVLEVALLVDGGGRAIGIGFTAPAGDLDATRQAFERLAASMTLR